MNEVVVVKNLKKSFGNKSVLKGISFSVKEGQLLCVLGPNGAGKTTMLEIIEGFMDPDQGEVRVFGKPPKDMGRDDLNLIGIMLQNSAPEPFLTTRELLAQRARYYKNPEDLETLARLANIEDCLDRTVTKLSGGQKRRVDLALSLIGRPKLLFLDEPTTGFDPEARYSSWETIKSLKDQGVTLILTTHYLEEAQYLSDSILILINGEIKVHESLSTLIQSNSETTITFKAKDGLKINGINYHKKDGVIEIRTSDPTKVLHELTKAAIEQNCDLNDIEVRSFSLERLYLDLVTKDQGNV